jgi:hypothetical protein
VETLELFSLAIKFLSLGVAPVITMFLVATSVYLDASDRSKPFVDFPILAAAGISFLSWIAALLILGRDAPPVVFLSVIFCVIGFYVGLVVAASLSPDTSETDP